MLKSLDTFHLLHFNESNLNFIKIIPILIDDGLGHNIFL